MMLTTTHIWRRPSVGSFILLLLVITFFSVPVFSQVTAGSLRIQVTDPNGNVIAGVSVTITRKDTNQSITATTSDQGVVVFNNLTPALYDVVVEKLGFARSVIRDVRVGISEANEVKFQLGIATAAVNVSIEAERQELLSALPNLNHDLTPLLQVIPGAIPGGPSTLGKVVIDGKGKDQQIIKLDGLDITQLVNVPSGDPSIDVLSSFQKPEVSYDIDNSSPKSRAFEPMFGPGSGIVIPAVSYKAGDAWRGQVYTSDKNDVFNARNYFDFDGKPSLRHNRFGGKAGGPLIKSRTGLYFGFDGVRARSESSVYEAVPVSASCGCGSGPLSSLMGGFLPAGTSIVPAASQDANFQVAKRRVRSEVDSNAWNVRLDKSFPNDQNLMVSFTRQRAESVVPDGVTGRLQRQTVIFKTGLAEFNFRSGKTLHDFRVGLNQNEGDVAVSAPASTAPELSRSVIIPSGSVTVTGLPINGTTVSKATLGAQIKNIGRGLNLRPISVNASYDFDHPINLAAGREFFFGLELRRIGMSYDRRGGLTYTFSTPAALQAGIADSVSLLSDLSAGAPFSSGVGSRHVNQTYFLGYFQMNWKVRRVSLKYGFRYDYFGAVHERDNRAVVVDPQTGTILNAGTSSFYEASKNNFQPRFGFEYTLADSGILKNVVWSGGAGLYLGVPRIDDMLLAIDSDRFSTGAAAAVYPVNPADLMKTFLDNPNTRQFQPLAFSRTFSTPERIYKWETSLTKTLKEIYKFKLLYTGNAGRNLAVAGVANQIVNVATNPDPTQPAIVVRQFDLINAGSVSKPYGEFYFRDSNGKSSYNAFTVQFARNSTPSTQTLPRWLNLSYLNIQYTLSRNVGNASGAVTSNPRNFGADYGYNAADARHSFTLSAVYNLWEAASRSQTGLWTGWQLATQIGARSGLPLVVRLDRPDVVYVDATGTVFSSPDVGRRAIINTPGGGASAATRVPNLIAGVDPYLHNRTELLNPAAFAIPAPGTFGNLTRGQLRGPGSVQVDLSVVRYLFKKERMSGEFKMEVSNLFNRVNFNNPTITLPNALGASAADNQIQPKVPFTAAAAGHLGSITAADPGRQFQFSLILKFNQGFTK